MTSNTELLSRRNQAVVHGVASMHPLFAERADNAEIWDVEGKRYIDFASGIAVLNTGHCHPRIMAAVNEQLQHFTHSCFQVMPYESYVALAERLNALAPGNDPKKTLLLTTGAEAVENAIKIARNYTKRSAVIAFGGGFHGRTMLALSLTGKVQAYKTGFGPYPAEIYHAPYPNPLHRVSGDHALEVLEYIFKVDVEAERVAAIIIEPVQGEGGFYIAPPEFLQRLRKLCDERGILLIADEIQTGFGRTGKMFAMEHSGVTPDIITAAKSLGGGFPLSAVIGRSEVMDSVAPGGLGGTYAGSPVACAAALAVLDVIEEERLLERSMRLGERLQARFRTMADRMTCIGDVRGLGGMVAIELFQDHERRIPAPELTKALTAKAAEHGLILLSCGLYGNVIRILVPLTASDELVDEGMTIIEHCLESLVLETA